MSNYEFVSTNVNEILEELTSSYEKYSGQQLLPASPETLVLRWVADVIIQQRVITNYTGNQNIPSRAGGKNLDALAELFYLKKRPDPKPSVCTMRFYLSAIRGTSILIPAGTRVSDNAGALVWATEKDIYVLPGEEYGEVGASCQTSGIIGNGYLPGQITTLIDIFSYYERCENLTISDGGADSPSDAEFYEQLRASMNAYSDAGSVGGYVYFATSASSEIADVRVTSPQPGHINIYALMKDGTLPSAEVKLAIYEACSAKTVRPIGDYVTVADAEMVEYDIYMTYYLNRFSTESAAVIESAVNRAVGEYIAWQSAGIGRDVNPSELHKRVMNAGVKRVDIEFPLFTPLIGDGETVPQVAKLRELTVINGGYEDE
ncbi:MAG: baseplate J/gp47 family protein [Oscillospiraceae bacterium]|nr:baseplate J/gp47 family protein [Oscillospiraceae bacterium]